MKYFILTGLIAVVLLGAGVIQQEAFSRPGNAPSSAPGLNQAPGGPPSPFTLPRTNNPRANERSRPGGPNVGPGQQLVVIPGQGVVISPN